MIDQISKVSPTPPSKALSLPESLEADSKEETSSSLEAAVFHMVPLSLLQIWNEHHGVLANVRDFTKERREHCRKRIVSHGGGKGLEQFSADFREAVKKAAAHPWKSWRPNFDWFVRNDTNFNAILEGKYDDWRSDAVDDKAHDNREARKQATINAAKRIAARYGEDIELAGETRPAFRQGNHR